MKHAYLIIAHNRPELLKNLVEMIDDERNDIFIHIDKKSNIKDFANIKSLKSELIFTKERINVVWADYSQIESELVLFREASSYGHYQYYHLLSGIDIPIKNQDTIHQFFDVNAGKEFVGYMTGKENDLLLSRRADLYHICTQQGRTRVGVMLSQLRRAFCVLQRMVGFKRKHDITLKIGPNWVSITDDFCRWIIEKSDSQVMRNFKYTSCGDELFVQSLLWNSPFKEAIYQKGENSFEGCMRLIDWTRGNPYIFQIADIDEIMASNRMFCRKVTDINLAKEIRKRIENQ